MHIKRFYMSNIMQKNFASECNNLRMIWLRDNIQTDTVIQKESGRISLWGWVMKTLICL